MSHKINKSFYFVFVLLFVFCGNSQDYEGFMEFLFFPLFKGKLEGVKCQGEGKEN